MSAAAQDFPEAVLFDFGGTLDADGVPSVAQFHAAYQAAGGRRAPEAFAEPFRRSDHDVAAVAGVAALGHAATVAAQVEHLARRLPDEPAVDWAAVAARVVAAARAAAARNRPVLAALGARARLGVVSNFTGNVDRCLDELGLLDLFGAVADSAVVGHAKPDPRVFRAALDPLGVAPGGALMVGDNPWADVQAAARLGMRTCWIAPAGRAAPDGVAPTFRVARLPELLAALEVDPRLRGDDDVLGRHPRASGDPRLPA